MGVDGGRDPHLLGLPRTDILLGRMVTAPSATSSRRSTGALLEPQLSEPIQKKWPVWLALRAASRTLLWGHSSPAQIWMATQLPPSSMPISQNPWLPLLPAIEDTPYTPDPLPAYAHPQAAPEPLTPDPQPRVASARPPAGSPTLRPMPTCMSTVTFRMQALQRSSMSPQIPVCPTWVPDDICQTPVFSEACSPGTRPPHSKAIFHMDATG